MFSFHHLDSGDQIQVVRTDTFTQRSWVILACSVALSSGNSVLHTLQTIDATYLQEKDRPTLHYNGEDC